MTVARRLALAVVPACLALASCTEIGLTVAVAPGAGKSGPEYDLDRRECMARTDREPQPVANTTMLRARKTDEMASANAGIQAAYDRNYDSYMAASGNLVPAPAVPLPGAPMPPTPELAVPMPTWDASNLPVLSDADSTSAQASIAPEVRTPFGGLSRRDDRGRGVRPQPRPGRDRSPAGADAAGRGRLPRTRRRAGLPGGVPA